MIAKNPMLAAIAVAVATLTGAAQAQNFISNGTFDARNQQNTVATSWTDNSVDFSNGNAELSNVDDYLYQDVSLAAGTYTLSFNWTRSQGNNLSPVYEFGTPVAGSNSVSTLLVSGNLGDGSSGTLTTDPFVVASDQVYRLRLSDMPGGNNNNGNDNNRAVVTFDNVSLTSVSAIPEPETYAMMLSALAALGFMGKRRRAK